MSPTPEVVFIFYTVGFILSGLPVAVLGWLSWQTGQRRAWLGRVPPFLLLAGSYGLGAWGSFQRLFETIPAEDLVFTASAVLETGALSALAYAILGGGRASLFLLFPLGELGLLAAGRADGHPLLAVVLAALASVAMFRKSREELRYEWVGMALIGASYLLAPWASPAASLRLLAVASFALSVEHRSADLFVRVFVRLNLTFIFLAGILMLLASQAERSRRMDFAAREVEDLAEFLRGHVMYYLQSGSGVDEVLGSPLILREIVAEFGHTPELRTVLVRVHDQELRVRIDDEGIIDEELREATGEEKPVSGRRSVTVSDVPIFLGNERVGQVVLEEAAASVNRDIARSIGIIFLAFTSAVTIASVIIGAIVYEASQTIEKQVGQIEQSERRLMQAAKLASVGELVSGVAHEINNPLGVILSRAEYLREEVPAPELVSDLDVIAEQARRISRIVRDLLDFARPHKLDIRDVELRAVLDPVLRLVAPRLRQQDIRVELDLLEPLPTLRGDPARLEQVLLNLVNNAADAMPKGGVMRFRAKADDSRVVLSLSDTGIGIASEDLERIFDPFFSKKDGKGTGLGLSVSYGIIRDHRGELWAESKPGKGSTFHIVLPVAGKHGPDDI